MNLVPETRGGQGAGIHATLWREINNQQEIGAITAAVHLFADFVCRPEFVYGRDGLFDVYN